MAYLSCLVRVTYISPILEFAIKHQYWEHYSQCLVECVLFVTGNAMCASTSENSATITQKMSSFVPCVSNGNVHFRSILIIQCRSIENILDVTKSLR